MRDTEGCSLQQRRGEENQKEETEAECRMKMNGERERVRERKREGILLFSAFDSVYNVCYLTLL